MNASVMNPAQAAAFADTVTLTNCEREPIHIPSAIQPHGGLLAFSVGSWVVLHASANVGQWLPVGDIPVSGRTLSEFVGEEGLAGIQSAMRTKVGEQVQNTFLQLPADPEMGRPWPLDLFVHAYRGVGVVEFEPTQPNYELHHGIQALEDALSACHHSESPDDLMDKVAKRVKRMIGFDRVMMYRFSEDWTGHVVVDAHDPGMPSFLDLRYPASDIPAQAREMYRTNLVRYIADVDYAPVAVRPLFDEVTKSPLDMSHCMLRSVSPMHIRYLQNMGVRSTLVMSILMEGKLWGLISCQNSRPTALPMHLRRACHALAAMVGHMLESQLTREHDRRKDDIKQALTTISDAFGQIQVDTAEVVDFTSASLLRVMGATAGALWDGDKLHPFGHWEHARRAADLLEHAKWQLQVTKEDAVWAQSVALTPPLTPDDAASACGYAAVGLDAFASRGLIWLRPEWKREVRWGGNPDKAMNIELDADGQPMLTPRNSFESWATQVKGTCRPWGPLDRHALATLKSLSQVMLARESLQQMQLRTQQFRSLVALQSDAYWQTDQRLRLVVLSRQLKGLSAVGMGRSLRDVFDGRADAESMERLIAALNSGKPFMGVRIEGQLSDGSPCAYLVNGEPLTDSDGMSVGLHGTITDVSVDHARQQRLTEERNRADVANRAKSHFLASMSHEIRTPLNAVIGLSYILNEEDLTAEQHRQVGKLRTAGQTLLSIVNNVLDLAKIEGGELELSESVVSLRKVFEEVEQMMSGIAQTRGLRLTIQPLPDDCPPLVMADATRLRQVLINLVGNSLKFTDEGSVTVSVRLLADTALDGVAKLAIEVEDTGVGINPEALPRLFAPFIQADSTQSRNASGTGLGLVIVKELAERMGGDVSVRSTLGQGSVFTVNVALPLPTSEQLEQAAVGHKSLRVLLATRDTPEGRSLCEMAHILGWQVNCLHSTQALLDKAMQLAANGHPPDCVLQDMDLDETPALTTLRQLRQSLQPHAMAIGFMGMQEQLPELSMSTGADNGPDLVLARPVTTSALFNAVNDAVYRHTGLHNHVIEGSRLGQPHLQWLPGVRVLLVDDSEMNLEVASRVLQRQGAEVSTCMNGRQALQWLQAGHPVDVVLMDVQMPVMDGNEAVKALRQDPTLSALPVIALTAGAMLSEREHSLASGMDDYLTKPIDPEDMVRVIRHLLQIKAGRLLPTRERGPQPGREAWPEVEGINKPFVQSRMGHDAAMFARLLKKTLKEFDPAELPSPDTLSTDRRTWAERMHKLAGSAGTLGASALAEHARALELALHAGAFDDASALLARVVQAWGDLNRAFDAAWPQAEATAPLHPGARTGAQAADQAQAVNQLRHALNTNDLSARQMVQRQADLWAELLGPAGLAEMDDAVTGLDYPRALALMAAKLGPAQPAHVPQ